MVWEKIVGTIKPSKTEFIIYFRVDFYIYKYYSYGSGFDRVIDPENGRQGKGQVDDYLRMLSRTVDYPEKLSNPFCQFYFTNDILKDVKRYKKVIFRNKTIKINITIGVR